MRSFFISRGRYLVRSFFMCVFSSFVSYVFLSVGVCFLMSVGRSCFCSSLVSYVFRSLVRSFILSLVRLFFIT